MSNKQKKADKRRIITIVTVIVAFLLVVNILLLIAVRFMRSGDEAVSPDNIIGIVGNADTLAFGNTGHLLSKQSALSPVARELALFSLGNDSKLTLSWLNNYDGKKNFEVKDMFPGDIEPKTYTVTVRSKNAQKLLFNVIITSETERLGAKLSDVLLITVKSGSSTLYSGLMKDLNITPVEYTLNKNVSSQDVTYTISVELPTSADNRYASMKLEADFKWTLEEKESSETTSTGSGTNPPSPPTPPPRPPVTTETTAPITEVTTAPPDTTEPDTTKPDTTEPGTTEPDDTKVPDHEHHYESTVVEPTCYSEGYTIHVCTCGHSYKDNIVPPTEHNYDEHIVYPVDGKDGYIYYVCPNCGHSYTVIYPATPETEDCCECAICHRIGSLFGKHQEQCIMCIIITALTGSDTLVCVCPWCCVIAVFAISVLASAILLLVLKAKPQKRIK